MTARHPELENILGVSLMRAAYGVESVRVAIIQRRAQLTKSTHPAQESATQIRANRKGRGK